MATFLPQIQDVTPELKLYSPNFELMEKWLSVKQERYDQNAMALGTMYSSLKSLPLTLDENITNRDQYLKQAEDQVKRLAEVDLSMPENYKAARSIFTPLLEDQSIMEDVTFTLKAQSLISANQSFKNSSEEEDRKRYNSNNDAYAALKLNEFKNSTPERRSALAKSNLSFVNNVNIMERAREIAKTNGLNMVYQAGYTDKNGNPSEVYFEYKNGEQVVGVAYNKLMSEFKSDPFVKEYYNQLGYINVQSRLQELAPQIGYDAAVQELAAEYQSLDNTPIKNQEAKEAADYEKTQAVSRVKNYESKISSEGIIPGSKEHRDYLKLKAEATSAQEELTRVGTEAFNISIGGAQSLEDLYGIASNVLYDQDLKSAAYDMAMSNSSKKMVNNPLYANALKRRELDLRAMKIALENGGSVSTDASGLPTVDLQIADAWKEPSSNVEKAEGNNKIEVITNELSNKAKDVIKAEAGSPFYDALDSYFKSGATIDGYPGGNLAKETILNEINNLVAAGNFTAAQNKINQISDIIESSINDGTAEASVVTNYKEFKILKDDLDKEYIKFNESLISIVNTEKRNALLENGSFADQPEKAVLLDYLIGEDGVRTKAEFRTEVEKAFRNGELSEELSTSLLEGATTYNLRTVSRERAIENWKRGIESGSSKLPESSYLEPKYDPSTGLVTLKSGVSISLDEAYDRVLSPRQKKELIDQEEVYYRNNPREAAGYVRANITRGLGKEYDMIYDLISERYEQAANYTPYGQSITALDNGAYALQRMTNGFRVDPINLKGEAAKVSNSIVVNLARLANANQLLLASGSMTEVVADKDEIKNRDRKNWNPTSDDNVSTEVFKVFTENYGRYSSKEGKLSTSSGIPRASISQVSNVLIGDERYTVFQFEPSVDWTSSVVNSGDGTSKKFSPGTETTMTFLIPQDVANETFSLPTSKIEGLYNATINSGLEYSIPNVGSLSFTLGQSNTGEDVINIVSERKIFDPATGNYKTVRNNSFTDANIISFTEIYEEEKGIMAQLEAINNSSKSEYNSANGATTNPEDLNQ